MTALDRKTKYGIFAGIAIAALGVLEVLSLPFDLFRDKAAFLNFSMLLLAFITLAIFLRKRTLTNLTTWWTMMILIQFGIAPLLCDFLGIRFIDSYSVQALVYVFLGTACFWGGAKLVERPSEDSSFNREALAGGDRRAYVGLIMLALGCASKLYMIRAGIFMYGSDIAQVEAASQYKEWLTILGALTLYAQIVLSIEFFCNPGSKLARFGFWITTAINIGFALVSGMKGEILVIPFLVFLIRKLTTGRFEMRLALGLAAVLLLLFPLNAFYRTEVHTEGAITSLEVGKNAIGRAVGSASEGSSADYLESAVESAAGRLNLLPVIVFLDQEQDVGGSSIEGDERLWMIPFYPFVPRFLWQDKPVLDKGRRLSLAMGSPGTTSTAVTPFGDLLVMGGVTALLIGMMFVGAAIQGITNLVSKGFWAKRLFVYCVLFSRFYAPESDIVMMGTSLLQTIAVALALAYLIYGGKFFGLGPPKPKGLARPRIQFANARAVAPIQNRVRR